MIWEAALDEERTDSNFTSSQIRTLQEFADNVAMGRRAFRLLAYLFGFVGAMTAFIYYVGGIIYDWHGRSPSK